MAQTLTSCLGIQKRNPVFPTAKDVKEFRNGCANKGKPMHKFLLNKFSLNFEIPKEEIAIDPEKCLGTGRFGSVSVALVNGSECAVRTVQPNCPVKNFKSWLVQLKLMSCLEEHKNIIRFIGAYTLEIESGSLLVVTEYHKMGSILNYLRKEVPGNYKDMYLLPTLVDFARQIATGMEFLASKKIVHGDLSAKNVMVDQRRDCKITKFGLPRNAKKYKKYAKLRKEPPRWKWMAVETLERFEFTTKADVWSFGVTLWEIFSRGDIPHEDVYWYPKLAEYFRLEGPERLQLKRAYLACKEIHSTMLQCCNLDATMRPDFGELRLFFTNLDEDTYQAYLP